jgi:hypothetical protein
MVRQQALEEEAQYRMKPEVAKHTKKLLQDRRELQDGMTVIFCT